MMPHINLGKELTEIAPPENETSDTMCLPRARGHLYHPPLPCPLSSQQHEQHTLAQEEPRALAGDILFDPTAPRRHGKQS